MVLNSLCVSQLLKNLYNMDMKKYCYPENAPYFNFCPFINHFRINMISGNSISQIK